MTTAELRQSSLGAYTLQSAALYIGATMKTTIEFPRLNARHLRRWLTQGSFNGEGDASDSDEFINFLELVSFRRIAMLRAHGIGNKAIRLAHDNLQKSFGWKYPFAMEPLWVGEPNIFIELEDLPVSVTQKFQAAFPFTWEFLEPIGNNLHGLTFNDNDAAVTWEPHSNVMMDPRIQLGAPCVTGTRIPTETLWAYNQAGDSVKTLASLYGIERKNIEAAIGWEERVSRVAEIEQPPNSSSG